MPFIRITDEPDTLRRLIRRLDHLRCLEQEKADHWLREGVRLTDLLTTSQDRQALLKLRNERIASADRHLRLARQLADELELVTSTTNFNPYERNTP